MAEEILKVERGANYVTLTLNRPERRNALNQALVEALDRALRSIEQDKEIRAVVIRGEGAHFCAGIDLAEVARTQGGHNPITLEQAFSRLEKLPVPTIAAIQGAALTGGLELALHCDLRIAAEDARLAMNLGRVGLVAPYDFVRKLIEVIGSPNTAYILYTAEPVDARRALAMGMVHDVVPNAALNEAAGALAAKIAGNAPLSLRAMKAVIRRCMSGAFDAWHDDLLEIVREVRQSEDAKEGVRAFLEKRKPVWKAQ